MSFVPREISDAEEPSYRIVGGTATLIEKLVAEVGVQNIKTQTKVTAIKEVDNHLEVHRRSRTAIFQHFTRIC
jgi:monoamine oxidase